MFRFMNLLPVNSERCAESLIGAEQLESISKLVSLTDIKRWVPWKFTEAGNSSQSVEHNKTFERKQEYDGLGRPI